MPEVDRLAMKCSSLVCLDEAQEKKDARIAELAGLVEVILTKLNLRRTFARR